MPPPADPFQEVVTPANFNESDEALKASRAGGKSNKLSPPTKIVKRRASSPMVAGAPRKPKQPRHISQRPQRRQAPEDGFPAPTPSMVAQEEFLERQLKASLPLTRIPSFTTSTYSTTPMNYQSTAAIRSMPTQSFTTSTYSTASMNCQSMATLPSTPTTSFTVSTYLTESMDWQPMAALPSTRTPSFTTSTYSTAPLNCQSMAAMPSLPMQSLTEPPPYLTGSRPLTVSPFSAESLSAAATPSSAGAASSMAVHSSVAKYTLPVVQSIESHYMEAKPMLDNQPLQPADDAVEPLDLRLFDERKVISGFDFEEIFGDNYE